ncbi:hypothetical protein [Aliarcobacter butzleri]|uniref:hypothetical protein n=1 Tax=Aliarcobacter butzleri TaxID=28197 RepID=UPI001260B3D7|nr:hypothetical protein [Aliarcobacter butzleri]
MKNLLTTLILIIAGIIFSGCSAKNIAYDKYTIERDINKDIDKISGKSVKIIDSSEQKITRSLYSAIGIKSPTISYELEAASINKNIANEFINQYFNNSGEEVFIINSKIKDFGIKGTLNPNNMDTHVEMEFTVTKNGKTILNKSYKKTADGVVLFELRLTLDETTLRKLQKTVFSIYNNEFKKDLIEALKNN